MKKFCLILIGIIFILLMFQNYEHFNNLYPVRDDYCETQGLKKAYMPQVCYLENGYYDPKANCRCRDPFTGLCKLCYPPSLKSFVQK